MRKTIPDFLKMKQERDKIVMLTAYDYPGAVFAQKSGIDMILVGDSLGMVVLGYDSTVPVTVEDMVYHSKAVRRGAPDTFIVTDLPYLSYTTAAKAIASSEEIIKTGGADAVKLEGGEEYLAVIRTLHNVGIPVVGHIGLTPQTASQLGGFKVQGRDVASARKLISDAKRLEEAGAFALVLEAIPEQVAAKITTEIAIPTIGIGAGSSCDGQVLVFHDMLGMFDRFKPKFVKQYANLGEQAVQAIKDYAREVKLTEFPRPEHSFTLADQVFHDLFEED